MFYACIHCCLQQRRKAAAITKADEGSSNGRASDKKVSGNHSIIIKFDL